MALTTYVERHPSENCVHPCSTRRNACSVTATGICIFIFLLSIWSLTLQTSNYITNIILIDVEKPLLHITGPYFLSIALDTAMIADGLKRFNTSNSKLRNLVKLLSPSYFRIGGTMADRLIFSANEQDIVENNIFMDDYHQYLDGGECVYDHNKCYTQLPNFTMTGLQWFKLNEFTKNTKMKMIFDINALLRNNNGSWNIKNAEALISYSNDHFFHVNWQLGNEPNAFKHVFDYSVNATQLAKDFSILRKLLNKYPRYKRSLLVGPDTTRPIPSRKASVIYLKEFISKSKHVINAVTWHQYYLNGREATIDQFVDPVTLKLFETQVDTINNIVNQAGFPDMPIWLGETSSAYGGGAPNLSDRFVGSFLWLDKLGIAARKGLDTIIRQSIFGGHYALINSTYDPNPDWWISILYKKFVGRGVVFCNSASIEKVRLYCHCAAVYKRSEKLSAVTVFGINMQPEQARVRLQGLSSSDYIKSDSLLLSEYVLTGETGLQSRTVLLNGVRLSLNSDGSLPVFHPRLTDINQVHIMPPYSLVFWVAYADVPACDASNDDFIM